MKKMGDEVDDEDYEEVCSENQWVTRQSDSDTVYWGIVPQHSVCVALSTYQTGENRGGEGKGTDSQHET